jgi:hypothetical protein
MRSYGYAMGTKLDEGAGANYVGLIEIVCHQLNGSSSVEMGVFKLAA